MSDKDMSQVVPQRDKLKSSLKIKTVESWTANQKTIISTILNKNTKLVFIDGLAGTAKTYTATYCGLQLLSDKKVSELMYIRTVIESASKGLGYLPGTSELKMEPFLRPLEDKLMELLSRQEIESLKKDKRIEGMPINYLRGSSFNAKYILSDESQNFDYKELTTLITRIGKFSKMIVCGDSGQSDIGSHSGFKKMFDLFNDEDSRNNGVFCFQLGKIDIVRSEVLKFIIEKLEMAKS